MEAVDLDTWLAEKQPRRREMIRALLGGSRIRRRPRDPGEIDVLIKLIGARPRALGAAGDSRADGAPQLRTQPERRGPRPIEA